MILHNRLRQILVVGLGLGLVNLGFNVSVAAQSQTDRSTAANFPNFPIAPAEPLTLSQAVEIALARNPLTRVTAAERELADAQLSAARAARLPSLLALESVTRSNNPVFVFGSLLEQGRFGPNNFLISSLNNPAALTNFRAGLSVRVPIFDQKQRQARIELARLGQQEDDQRTELVAQQIRFAVLKS